MFKIINNEHIFTFQIYKTLLNQTINLVKNEMRPLINFKIIPF